MCETCRHRYVVYIHIYICNVLHICIWIYIYLYIYMYAYTSTSTYTYTHAYTYTYTCRCIYIYRHIYAREQQHSQKWSRWRNCSPCKKLAEIVAGLAVLCFCTLPLNSHGWTSWMQHLLTICTQMKRHQCMVLFAGVHTPYDLYILHLLYILCTL